MPTTLDRELENQLDQAADPLLEGHVTCQSMCTDPKCQGLIPKGQERYVGPYRVCQKGYDRWFFLQED